MEVLPVINKMDKERYKWMIRDLSWSRCAL